MAISWAPGLQSEPEIANRGLRPIACAVAIIIIYRELAISLRVICNSSHSKAARLASSPSKLHSQCSFLRRPG